MLKEKQGTYMHILLVHFDYTLAQGAVLCWILSSAVSLELQVSGCNDQVKQAGERIAELEGQLSGYRQQLTVTQDQLEQTTAQLQEKKVSHWRWYIGPDNYIVPKL